MCYLLTIFFFLTLAGVFIILLLRSSTCFASPDKAAADANAAAWAAYYAQYGQQPQAPMTPTSGAPGTSQSNGQGN